MEKPNYQNKPIKETNPHSTFWQRSLLMNGLGWLGMFGFLSSSIVWVQNPNSGTAIAAPNVPEIMPKAVPDVPASTAKEPEPVFIRRTPNAATNRPRTRQNRVTQSRSSGNSNTNSYIDPTDYSIGATNRRDVPGRSYQPPSAVVFRERYNPRRQRVVPPSEPFSIEEPSIEATRVRPRVRRGAVTARRRDTSRNQISRAPRTYEIERRTRSTQNNRASRNYEIERITIEPSNSRVSRRRFEPETQNTQIARARRRSGATVAAANQVNVGPIKVTPNGIRMSRSGVIRRGETRIASSNLNGLAGNFRTNQSSRNRVLNYYYNSVNPSDSSDNESNKTNLAMIFPLAIPAQITSMFGWRMHPVTGEKGFHAGTDIGAPMGTPVLAAHAGRVALADFLGGYGLAVVLRHNQDAQETRYGHLSEVAVKPGDWVEQGTVIGRVGDSGNTNGPHLHFEVREQTPQGWVAKDPGVQLEYSLARLMRAFQSGQATLPQDTQPYEVPPNTLQKEQLSPQIPVPSAELPVIPIPGNDAPPPLLSAGE